MYCIEVRIAILCTILSPRRTILDINYTQYNIHRPDRGINSAREFHCINFIFITPSDKWYPMVQIGTIGYFLITLGICGYHFTIQYHSVPFDTIGHHWVSLCTIGYYWVPLAKVWKSLASFKFARRQRRCLVKWYTLSEQQ